MVIPKFDEDKKISLLTTAVSMGTAMGLRRLLEGGWKKFNNGKPPKNPADRTTSWRDAILWTLATAVVLGLAKVVSRRLAIEGYDRYKRSK